MFTFGREHEIKHVIHFVGSNEKAALLVAVVNAVHDLLEGKASLTSVESAIRMALVEGKSGIWESAGSWLVKLRADYPATQTMWLELARHSSADVRFRVASHILNLSEPERTEVYSILKLDKSKRVREHALAKWDFQQHPAKYA